MLIHVIGRSCPNWPASARPETVLIFAIPSTGVVPELQPLYVNPKLGSRNLRSSFFPEIAQSKGLKLQPHCLCRGVKSLWWSGEEGGSRSRLAVRLDLGLKV